MDKNYADTVRLLLAVTPEVFANDIFAMKGGTAINLFVQDMPRLSVDIDVVYRPWQRTSQRRPTPSMRGWVRPDGDPAGHRRLSTTVSMVCTWRLKDRTIW